MKEYSDIKIKSKSTNTCNVGMHLNMIMTTTRKIDNNANLSILRLESGTESESQFDIENKSPQQHQRRQTDINGVGHSLLIWMCEHVFSDPTSQIKYEITFRSNRNR